MRESRRQNFYVLEIESGLNIIPPDSSTIQDSRFKIQDSRFKIQMSLLHQPLVRPCCRRNHTGWRARTRPLIRPLPPDRSVANCWADVRRFSPCLSSIDRSPPPRFPSHETACERSVSTRDSSSGKLWLIIAAAAALGALDARPADSQQTHTDRSSLCCAPTFYLSVSDSCRL